MAKPELVLLWVFAFYLLSAGIVYLIDPFGVVGLTSSKFNPLIPGLALGFGAACFVVAAYNTFLRFKRHT